MRNYWQELPRRIHDTHTGEVYWYSFKDRKYHDQSARRSFFPSHFFNHAGQLSAFYEVAA